MSPLVIYLGFLLLLPLMYYAAYPLIIKILSGKNVSSGETTNEFTPFVSIIIPTHNEMKMVERRIRNLDELDYPKSRFEAIFVDGASSDGTPDYLERIRNEGGQCIRVIRQTSREGYNSAIYQGICQAKADIIVTAEAGSFFHPKAITNVVRNLIRPSVGVSTGRSVLYNPDESLATRLEATYRKTHDAIRSAESKIDSTPDMKGELLAFRKHIGLGLKPGEVLPDYAYIDMAIAYSARSLGLKAVLDPDAIFYEYAPTTMKQRLTAQIRRATGFTGALVLFRSIVLNPKYGYFGMLIAPSRVLMLIVFPWWLLATACVVLWESLSAPLLGIGMLAFVALALTTKRTRYIFISFVLSQFVLAIATLRLLFRKHPQMIDTVPTARR